MPILCSAAWIVKLGPQEYGEDKLYSYFINTGALGLKPYVVVARDLKDFKTKYDNGITNWLKTKGFPNPVPIEQPEGCVYEGDTKK